MESKALLFFKNLFFKSNAAFLFGQLEEKLKLHNAFQLILAFLRKRIIFYIVAFSLFCFLLSNIPLFLDESTRAILNHDNIGHMIGVCSFISLLFLGSFYLKRFLQSILLRDFEFLTVRLQVARRYLSQPINALEYKNYKATHMLQFVFSILSVIPLIILYKTLFAFAHLWIFVPAFVNFVAFCMIGFLYHKNIDLKKETNENYKNDVNFFSSIENFLEKIRILGFDSILKKKIFSFSKTNLSGYQQIFENEILISWIKYCSIFFIFCLNSMIFLIDSKTREFLSFLPVLVISAFIAYYFLYLIKSFDFWEDSKKLFGFFKSLNKSDIYVRSELENETEKDNNHVISFENASFVKNNQVIFHQMNHNLNRNLLICVIGSRPEERTDYLNACVGNLEQIGGKVYRPLSFGFLPRHPILFDDTIRENIILSNDFDPAYYREVLKACALDREIDLLGENDLTELNKNGTEFDASFLRKISIARIVYSKSPVNFFDEPFLGISQQEAAQIFFEAFQKLLSNTSRIFCTERIEFGALSNEILLCKTGQIIEKGSHVSLISYESMYARLFSAGAEGRRIEILQNYAKHQNSNLKTPIRTKQIFKNSEKSETSAYFFGEQLFDTFKNRVDKFSKFIKEFFPVLVSKDFYAFFTFLILSVWFAVYSFYFIFHNLSLNLIAKTAILFLSFAIISSISFSIMLIFYKNVFVKFSYIVENLSKVYFLNLITRNHSEHRKKFDDQPNEFIFDCKDEHILSVTSNFFKHLLNFLIIGFTCIGLIVFVSTLSSKFLILGVLSIIALILFAHSIFETNFFFNEEDSKYLNLKFQHFTKHFFDSYKEIQSKNLSVYLLERVQAKLYPFYFAKISEKSKDISIFKILGFNELWQNFHSIESMIAMVKTEPRGVQKKTLPFLWPEFGAIKFQNVKFNYENELQNTFSIPPKTRFMYIENLPVQTSVFIEKIRFFSPVLSGEIYIDDEDLSLLNPTDIRRCIGVISQTAVIPFLSIRDHLDPYDICDDADIWETLNKVGLSQKVALFKHGLLTLMEKIPQEMHWSGEIVLFSFARCLLNQNKIVCVDQIEISEEVENKICNLVESEFSNSTIIFTTNNEKFKNLCSMVYPEQTLQNEKFVSLPESNASQTYVQET